MKYIAALDQSTTATKFTLYLLNGRPLHHFSLPHSQITPQPGWLEQCPHQLYHNTQVAIQHVLQQTGLKAEDICGLGVTTQRETVICWDQQGKPFGNAIVWLDTRCTQLAREFKEKYGEFKEKTGLPFRQWTIFRILWLREHNQSVRQAMDAGKIKFGTVDTWLVYKMTGQYVTDVSNACRTYLCNLDGEWDKELLKLAHLTPSQLPTIKDSFTKIGSVQKGSLKGVEVCCMMADQIASAYAHQLGLNEAKITYGTGCFLLMPTGNKPIFHETLITTILSKKKGQVEYALEWATESGGMTLNWAQKAGYFAEWNEVNQWDHSEHQVSLFPSFGEIWGPFWSDGIDGTITGLSLASTKQHIIGAILESIIFRVQDNMRMGAFDGMLSLWVDGGLTSNGQLMQAQADILGREVVVRERDTSWGIARGVCTCLDYSFHEYEGQVAIVFKPCIEKKADWQGRYERWSKMRNRLYGWEK